MQGLNDTIVALSSARGIGALSIIRLSGSLAHECVSVCLQDPALFRNESPNKIRGYLFVDPKSKEVLDSLTAIKYQAPRSFTGEPMVELICHGSEYLVDCILSALIRSGARIAQPGEFSKRAFLNGKIDLLQAEAVNSIICSRSSAQLSSAVDMYRGGSGKALEKIQIEIESLLVDIESSIEFPEEDDIKSNLKSSHLERIGEIKRVIASELAKLERIQRSNKGIIVVILGESNTGKSTLFNAILNFDRSLVHNSRGTTRDFISEDLFIDGTLLTLIDTAGVGDASHEVEALGIERSWNYVDGADIAILVTSAESASLSTDEKKIIGLRRNKKNMAIISKTDLGSFSAKQKELFEFGIEGRPASLIEDSSRCAAREFVLESIKRMAPAGHTESSLLINARHEGLARQILSEMDTIEKLGVSAEEIVALHLNNALQKLGEFTNVASEDDILNRIFEKFCIGK